MNMPLVAFEDKKMNPLPVKGNMQMLSNIDVYKNLLDKLDKNKYFLKSKNIIFKENFNDLLSFFYKLRSIGANINTEKRKKSLIKFRKEKTNLSVFYNINFVLIKKL